MGKGPYQWYGCCTGTDDIVVCMLTYLTLGIQSRRALRCHCWREASLKICSRATSCSLVMKRPFLWNRDTRIFFPLGSLFASLLGWLGVVFDGVSIACGGEAGAGVLGLFCGFACSLRVVVCAICCGGICLVYWCIVSCVAGVVVWAAGWCFLMGVLRVSVLVYVRRRGRMYLRLGLLWNVFRRLMQVWVGGGGGDGVL